MSQLAKNDNNKQLSQLLQNNPVLKLMRKQTYSPGMKLQPGNKTNPQQLQKSTSDFKAPTSQVMMDL